MSFLEQACITKSAFTLVSGSADQGLQWGVMSSDFLLSKAVSSSRFKTIVVLATDRSTTDIEHSCRGEAARKSGKLKVVTLSGLSSVREIVEKLKNEVKDVIITDGKEQHETALFINSLSELLILFGSTHVFALLRELQQHQQQSLGTSGTLGCIPFTRVVATLHETLHETSLIRHLQGLFTVIVTTRPNDGTLSSRVLARIHTVRRSGKTGKVSEEMELFGHENGVLLPLHVRKFPVGDEDSGESENGHKDIKEEGIEITGENMIETILSSAAKKSGLALDASSASASVGVSSTASKSKAKTGTVAMVPSIARLVTFDSTDPEFDEDSDPDNDLDL